MAHEGEPMHGLHNLVIQLIASNLAPLYVKLRGEGKTREEALVETLTAWSELRAMLERFPEPGEEV